MQLNITQIEIALSQYSPIQHKSTLLSVTYLDLALELSSGGLPVRLEVLAVTAPINY